MPLENPLGVFSPIAQPAIAVLLSEHALSVFEGSVPNMPLDWRDFGPGIFDGPGH
jgi:hypothetical protein